MFGWTTFFLYVRERCSTVSLDSRLPTFRCVILCQLAWVAGLVNPNGSVPNGGVWFDPIIPCVWVFYLHLGHGFANPFSSNIHPELVSQCGQISGVLYMGAVSVLWRPIRWAGMSVVVLV